MSNDDINKLCFIKLEEMIQAYKLEFLQDKIDNPLRLQTFYPFINKVNYL